MDLIKKFILTFLISLIVFDAFAQKGKVLPTDATAQHFESALPTTDGLYGIALFEAVKRPKKSFLHQYYGVIKPTTAFQNFALGTAKSPTVYIRFRQSSIIW